MKFGVGDIIKSSGGSVPRGIVVNISGNGYDVYWFNDNKLLKDHSIGFIELYHLYTSIFKNEI